MAMIDPNSNLCKYNPDTATWSDSGRVCKLTPYDRFMAGLAYGFSPCKNTRKSVMEDYGISRSYVYKLKDRAMSRISATADPDNTWICADKDFQDRFIVALSTVCQASLEEIRMMQEACFGKPYSIGKISGIISQYAEKAAQINEQVSLSSIKQIALDEVYQGDRPVLTGIDLDSTYIVMMVPAADRQKDTWEIELCLKKEQGLNPELSISDACSSILSAVPEVFDFVTVQIDVFHALKELGEEVEKEIRHGEADLDQYYDLQKRVSGSRPHKKTIDKFHQSVMKLNDSLQRADAFSILLGWTRELLAFPGYTVEETTELLGWILDSMEDLAGQKKKLREKIRTFRNNIPRTLRYLEMMFQKMSLVAKEKGFDPELFRELYLLRRNDPKGELYAEKWYELGKRIEPRWNEFQQMTDCMHLLVCATKRASSLVENLNSRLRKVMNAKRMVPDKFFSLIQLYFNTKKYRRSQIPDRVGKSPMQMLLGEKEAIDFFTLLGFKPVKIAPAIV